MFLNCHNFSCYIAFGLVVGARGISGRAEQPKLRRHIFITEALQVGSFRVVLMLSNNVSLTSVFSLLFFLSLPPPTLIFPLAAAYKVYHAVDLFLRGAPPSRYVCVNLKLSDVGGQNSLPFTCTESCAMHEFELYRPSYCCIKVRANDVASHKPVKRWRFGTFSGIEKTHRENHPESSASIRHGTTSSLYDP